MELNDMPHVNEHTCIHCQGPIKEGVLFCNHCGLRQFIPDIDDAVHKQSILIGLSVFFGIQLLVCLISHFNTAGHSLISLFVFDGIITIATITYAVIYGRELKPFFRWPHFSIVKLLSYVSTAIIAAIVVNYIVKWLNRSIFNAESYYYYAFSNLKYAKLITVLVVALQPAIIEELAFRGVMQQGLSKVVDQRQAIFITAFLFSLLHLSFISFFWLLPFALWLGFIRKQEETLWYGVAIHFCFNTTACFLEFFELNLF